MRGAPLQTREEAEAAIDALEDQERDRLALENAWDKIDGALNEAGIGSGNRSVRLRFSILELRVLRQFRRKFA